MTKSRREALKEAAERASIIAKRAIAIWSGTRWYQWRRRKRAASLFNAAIEMYGSLTARHLNHLFGEEVGRQLHAQIATDCDMARPTDQDYALFGADRPGGAPWTNDPEAELLRFAFGQAKPVKMYQHYFDRPQPGTDRILYVPPPMGREADIHVSVDPQPERGLESIDRIIGKAAEGRGEPLTVVEECTECSFISYSDGSIAFDAGPMCKKHLPITKEIGNGITMTLCPGGAECRCYDDSEDEPDEDVPRDDV